MKLSGKKIKRRNVWVSGNCAGPEVDHFSWQIVLFTHLFIHDRSHGAIADVAVQLYIKETSDKCYKLN